MERVRSGELPWTPLDALHRSSLDDVLASYGLGDVPAQVRDELVLAWHRLDPWPDVRPGLGRLRREVGLAPPSHSNAALRVDLARRSGLPGDCGLGAGVGRPYQPGPGGFEPAPQSPAGPPSA